jgi:hypothetical protein
VGKASSEALAASSCECRGAEELNAEARLVVPIPMLNTLPELRTNAAENRQK